MDEKLKSEILTSIILEGGTLPEHKEFNLIIANRTQASFLLNMSSGKPKIRSVLLKQFQLILSQPLSLASLSPLQIRCCLCGKVISYPSWLLINTLTVNKFYYFVCFNRTNIVNTDCYRVY